jgi:hypothetical protein
MLSARILRYSICLLYWYKSTNTDARGAASLVQTPVANVALCSPAAKDSKFAFGDKMIKGQVNLLYMLC